MRIKAEKRKKMGFTSWIIIGIIMSSIIFVIFFLLDIYLINKDNPLITIADALSYFGASMGAIFGIVGIVLTIKYTQSSIDDQRQEYLEEKIIDNVLSICPLIQIRKVKAGLESYGKIDVCEKDIANFDSSMQNFMFEISNKGNGVAQNVTLNAELVTDKPNYLYLLDPELSECPEFKSYLNVDEKLELSFTIFYNIQNEANRDLHVRLRIEYTDIFLNTYVEIYDFHFNVQVQKKTNVDPSKHNITPFTGRFTHKELISRVVTNRKKEVINIGIAYEKE